jgi:hypothetical protein
LRIVIPTFWIGFIWTKTAKPFIPCFARVCEKRALQWVVKPWHNGIQTVRDEAGRPILSAFRPNRDSHALFRDRGAVCHPENVDFREGSLSSSKVT